ncbi:MAG: hypothetical protein WDZ35_09705 [Crocinitomicaceae bacterium]
MQLPNSLIIFFLLLLGNSFAQEVRILEDAPLWNHTSKLLAKNVKHYTFSKDGRRVIYITSDDIEDRSGALYVVNTDGTNKIKLADDASSIYVADLEQLIYGSDQGAFIINVDGTNKVKLSPENCARCTPAAVSLDAGLIVMKRFDKVYLVDFDGKVVAEAPQHGTNNGAYHFFEEENSIVYWSEGKLRMFNYLTKILDPKIEELDKWYEPFPVNGELFAYFGGKLYKIDPRKGNAECLSCDEDFSIRSQLIAGKNGISVGTTDWKRYYYDIASDTFYPIDFKSGQEKENSFVQMNEDGTQLLNGGFISEDFGRKNRKHVLYLFESESKENKAYAKTSQATTVIQKHMDDRYKIIHTQDVEQMQMNFYLYDYLKDSLYRITQPISGWSNFYISPKGNKIIYRKQHTISSSSNSFQGDIYILDLEKLEKDSTQEVGLVENKKVDVQHEISVTSDEITLKFWDGQSVDGDRISVKLNNKWLFQDLELKKIPKKLTVKLPKKGQYNLVMIALNEGDIPPNTASVLIIDGNKKNQISLSSDLHNAGTVKLIRIR